MKNDHQFRGKEELLYKCLVRAISEVSYCAKNLHDEPVVCAEILEILVEHLEIQVQVMENVLELRQEKLEDYQREYDQERSNENE